jgi:hypothetical protein
MCHHAGRSCGAATPAAFVVLGCAQAVVSSLQSSCAVPVRMVGPTDHFDHTSSNPSHLVIFAGGIGVGTSVAYLAVHCRVCDVYP